VKQLNTQSCSNIRLKLGYGDTFTFEPSAAKFFQAVAERVHVIDWPSLLIDVLQVVELDQGLLLRILRGVKESQKNWRKDIDNGDSGKVLS
jgi:hypothetical protein